MPSYCDFHEMYHDSVEECHALRVAADVGRKLAARREKAERIARKAMDERGWVAGDHLSFRQALHVATSAALAALTEKEG